MRMLNDLGIFDTCFTTREARALFVQVRYSPRYAHSMCTRGGSNAVMWLSRDASSLNNARSLSTTVLHSLLVSGPGRVRDGDVCWLLGVTRWGPVRRAALPQVNLDDDLFETEDDNSFEVVVRVRMRA